MKKNEILACVFVGGIGGGVLLGFANIFIGARWLEAVAGVLLIIPFIILAFLLVVAAFLRPVADAKIADEMAKQDEKAGNDQKNKAD